MPIGWDEVQRIKRVEAKANELGFMFSTGSYSYGKDVISYICLKPKDTCLPHYSRGAELFTGTLDDINTWLRGIEWARNYDEMLKLSNSKKREAKEQVEKNKQLMKTLKTGKLVQGINPGRSLEEAYDEDYDDEEYDDSLPF